MTAHAEKAERSTGREHMKTAAKWALIGAAALLGAEVLIG